jgi:hypothetical protein
MTKRPAKLWIVALVAAWVGILLTAGDSPAQLYRYIDKNGKVVYTDNPPAGVMTDVIEKGKTDAPPAPEEAAPPAPPSVQGEKGRQETEKVTKEDADKEVARKMAEEAARKQEDRQRRLEEADRLEQEAKKSVQPTQENIDRQMKLMLEAQRLRETP